MKIMAWLALLSGIFLALAAPSIHAASSQNSRSSGWILSIDQLPWKVVIRDNDDPLGLIVRTEFLGTVKFIEDDEFRVDIEARGSDNTTRKAKDVVDYSFLAFDAPDGLTMMLQVYESSELSTEQSGLWYKLGISLGLLLGSVLVAAIMLIYMYRTITKRDKAEAYGKNRKYALADDVKDYIINKFGVYLVRRARIYSEKMSKKADKLEAIWKRSSNYSRSSRIMKPSEVRARQVAVMSRSKTNNQPLRQEAEIAMDAGMYAEPVYEEADDVPKETIIDRFGVHLMQEAKSYTEGFSNQAERLETVLSTKRSSMYSRLSSNEGDNQPMTVAADIHRARDHSTDTDEELPRGNFLDKYGVHLIRKAREYSDSLTRKADKLEMLWKRSSYPASSLRSDVPSDTDATYSSDFFLRRTAGVGADSDYQSDADVRVPKDTVVDDTGVHLVKTTSMKKVSRKASQIRRSLNRLSYPTYGSMSSRDHLSMMTLRKRKANKTRRSLIRSTTIRERHVQAADDDTDDYGNGKCDGDADADTSDTDDGGSSECLLSDKERTSANQSPEKVPGKVSEKRSPNNKPLDITERTQEDQEETNSGTSKEGSQSPEEEHAEDNSLSVLDEKERIAMEDSLTGSFTNSGYDSDSDSAPIYSAPPSPDVSPCVIMNQMSEALKKRRSSASVGYHRQLSTPSPDRSPAAIRHQMAAPFETVRPDSESEYALPEEPLNGIKKADENNKNEDDTYYNDSVVNNVLGDVNSNPVCDDSDAPEKPPPPPTIFPKHSGSEPLNNTSHPNNKTAPVVCRGDCRIGGQRQQAKLCKSNNNPGDPGMKVLPCGPHCVHSRTPHQTPSSGLHTQDKTSGPNPVCVGTFCSVTKPCGTNCIHHPTNRQTASKPSMVCQGKRCTVATPCGKHCVHIMAKQQQGKLAQDELCRIKRCTAALPCGVQCIHKAAHHHVVVGESRGQASPNILPAKRQQIVGVLPSSKRRTGSAKAKIVKTATSQVKVLPGKTVTIKVPPKVTPPPVPSEATNNDDVKLPSRKKGGWMKRGKKLNLTTLTVLTVVCLAIPVVCASINNQVIVDITIHVPKGYIKPGIQVFFNTEKGGKIDTEEWKHPIKVLTFDVRKIRVDLSSATAANCTVSNCQHGCDLATGDCVCRRGFVLKDTTNCEACSVSCPYGSYQDSPCNDNEEKNCVECTRSCPDGMFISKPCGQFNDIECEVCRKPCGPGEFESVPCAGTTDRHCEALDAIPPVLTSPNVVVEDLRHVRSQDTGVFNVSDNDTLSGKQITFDRGSGYTINITIDVINLRPLYESVDHSAGNDLAYAPELHKRLCAYPVPEYYTLAVNLYENITTLTTESDGVYTRSATEPCTTQFGYTAGVRPPSYKSNSLACSEPSSLSDLFRRDHLLETYSSLRVDKTQRCYDMNRTCALCSDRCAKSFDATTKTNIYCRLPASSAEVRREGSESLAARMKECFKCCLLGNCSICLDYQKQCQDQLRCRTGNILVYTLMPHYSADQMYCHVQPKHGSIIYRLEYRIYNNGELLKNKTFVAERVVDTSHPAGFVSGIRRHNFLIVRHGTGVSRTIHIVRGSQTFEAGVLEPGQKLLPTTSRRLKLHPTEPFGINTKTWKWRSCNLNVNRTLRSVKPTWRPFNDVRIIRIEGGYLVQNRTVEPHFQVILPSHFSILDVFFGPTQLKNDRTLRAELLRNNSFWIVKVSGQITTCPGLINVHIKDPQFGHVSLFHYDVGIDCPEDFSLEFQIPTGGQDVHDKRLILEMKDSQRTINVTLFRPIKINKYYFGNPKPVPFSVRRFLINLSPFIIGTIALLIALVAILAYGYVTRPDPLHRGRDNRLHKRHLLFIIWFIVFKFVYSLLISVTEFVLIAKAVHSSTFNVLDQYPDYHQLVAHYERIELDKIRNHLDAELRRQEMQGAQAKRVCEVQLHVMHRQVEEARENLLKVYYHTVQGFDIGSLAFEKIRETVDEYTERLKEFQADFDRYARRKARQLMADIRQVYEDVKNNNWLAGARIIHLTVNGLCFGCLEPFMKWVGLEFDFKQVDVPDLMATFPEPNMTLFRKPAIGQPTIPELPPMDFNPIAVQNLSTDIHNIAVDPERYKKYVPKAEFNFFLNSLRQNALIIFLVVIDSLWFAFRCTRTYSRVIELLHGFNYEIDIDEEDSKPKKGEEDIRSRKERAQAAIKSGLFKLLDILLDICIRIFALLKNLYYRVMNTDLVPQMLLVLFLILTIYLLIIITENMLDVDTLWNLGYFHLKVAPIIMSRKVANTRITANAFKINNLEYKFYETLVNMRLKQYRTLLKTYNRLMCERTSFQAVEYCAWWRELYPEEPCVPPVVKQIQINFTTCDLPPVEPIIYTDFDSLAYRLELKRSMKPYVSAMQKMILDSFTALGIMVAVFVIMGALGQGVMALLKRFDLVRLLKVYNNTKDPSLRKEFLPLCLDEDKNANQDKKPIGAVKINTDLFGGRTHTAPTVFIQNKTLIR